MFVVQPQVKSQPRTRTVLNGINRRDLRCMQQLQMNRKLRSRILPVALDCEPALAVLLDVLDRDGRKTKWRAGFIYGDHHNTSIAAFSHMLPWRSGYRTPPWSCRIYAVWEVVSSNRSTITGWDFSLNGTRHKPNSLSGNTLFTYMPTYTRSEKIIKINQLNNSTLYAASLAA